RQLGTVADGRCGEVWRPAGRGRRGATGPPRLAVLRLRPALRPARRRTHGAHRVRPRLLTDRTAAHPLLPWLAGRGQRDPQVPAPSPASGGGATRSASSAPSPACGGRPGWGRAPQARWIVFAARLPPPQPSPASGGGGNAILESAPSPACGEGSSMIPGEQLPPDQHPPNLVGAGADRIQLGVAQDPPGRVLVDVAV